MNLEPSPGASNSHDLAMNTQKHDVQTCLKVVHEALLDVKAKEIVELDVSSISNVSDAIVIASGTSTRHVKALADNVAEEARKAGIGHLPSRWRSVGCRIQAGRLCGAGQGLGRGRPGRWTR